MILASYRTFFRDRERAERIAAANSKHDEWTYRVHSAKQNDHEFVIAVYDENQTLVNYL